MDGDDGDGVEVVACALGEGSIRRLLGLSSIYDVMKCDVVAGRHRLLCVHGMLRSGDAGAAGSRRVVSSGSGDLLCRHMFASSGYE